MKHVLKTWEHKHHSLAVTQQNCIHLLFLFQTSCAITRRWLVKLCLISTPAKSIQKMKETLRFNLEMKLSWKERLVKVT